MLINKKIIATLLASTMLFSACGNNTKTNETPTTKVEEKTTEQAKEPAESTEPVKIELWYAVSGSTGEIFQAMLDEFNQSQNEVIVEASYSGNYADTANKISASLMSGAVPNVAMMAAGSLYTGGRNNFTMTDLIKNDSEFDINDIYEGVQSYGMFDGKICSIPYGISAPVFYYNKDIIAAAGLDFEANPPKTWDEVFEASKIILEKGNINNAPDFSAFDTSDPKWVFKTMLSQVDNTVVSNENGKVTPIFNDEKGVKIAEMWKKYIDSGIMLSGQHENAEKKFLAGNLGIVIATSNRMNRWATENTIKLGAIEMPYFDHPSVALGGNTLVMFNKDANADEAAWKLIKYLSSAEKQTEFAIKTGYLPIHKTGKDLDIAKEAIASNPLYNIAFKQLDYSWSYINFDEMGTMDVILQEALDEIETSKQTPEAALNDAANKLNLEIE